MPVRRPWHRNNTTLAGILPLLIVFAAFTQSRFNGVAQLVAQGVAGVLLLGFIVLVTTNARARTRCARTLSPASSPRPPRSSPHHRRVRLRRGAGSYHDDAAVDL